MVLKRANAHDLNPNLAVKTRANEITSLSFRFLPPSMMYVKQLAWNILYLQIYSSVSAYI